MDGNIMLDEEEAYKIKQGMNDQLSALINPEGYKQLVEMRDNPKIVADQKKIHDPNFIINTRYEKPAVIDEYLAKRYAEAQEDKMSDSVNKEWKFGKEKDKVEKGEPEVE